MANLVQNACVDCGAIRVQHPNKTTPRCRPCHARANGAARAAKGRNWCVDDACPACGKVRAVHKKKIGTMCKSCCVRLTNLGRAPWRTHGHSAGGKRSPTWLSWASAKQRCFTPSSPSYPAYGGRGITMCERWRNSFQAFLEDMGERPDGTSLERLDSDRGYEPGNCVWATPVQQIANRRNTVLVEVDGRVLTLREAAAAIGISYSDALHQSQRGQLKRVPNAYQEVA